MKIVSINSRFTISREDVAFNLDEPITDHAVRNLSLNATVHMSEHMGLKVIRIQKDEPISKQLVDKINERLVSFGRKGRDIDDLRNQVLQSVSSLTELPIDNPSFVTPPNIKVGDIIKIGFTEYTVASLEEGIEPSPFGRIIPNPDKPQDYLYFYWAGQEWMLAP